MSFAVQFYFDRALEDAVFELRRALTAAGVTPTLDHLGDRPHVSASVLALLDAAVFRSCLERLSRSLAPFSIALSALGAFPTAEGVLFLTPAPTASLLQAQRLVHEELLGLGASPSPYYVPEAWVPHCTIALDLPTNEVHRAFQIGLANFRPLSGQVRALGVIEFPPVKALYGFPLGGTNTT
jgi:2'-5' RNA ligase